MKSIRNQKKEVRATPGVLNQPQSEGDSYIIRGALTPALSQQLANEDALVRAERAYLSELFQSPVFSGASHLSQHLHYRDFYRDCLKRLRNPESVVDITVCGADHK